MKQKILSIIGLFCMSIASIANAEWTSPSYPPPYGTIAPPVVTGTQYQIKSGTTAALTVQRGNKNILAPADFTFFSDSGIGVDMQNYRGSYSDWSFNGGDFGLDMNAPLYAGAAFSTGRVVVLGATNSDSIKVSNLNTTSQVSTLNKVAFWPGKINQYTTRYNIWYSDNYTVQYDSMSKDSYCSLRFPNTVAVQAGMETITGWRDSSGGGPYTKTVQTYDCVPTDKLISVCADSLYGKFIPCTSSRGGEQLAVSIDVDKSTIIEELPTPITVSWKSNGVKCYPLSGLGFSTGEKPSGSDVSNQITLKGRDRHSFTVACVDSSGNSRVATVDINSAPMNSPAQLPVFDLKIVDGTMGDMMTSGDWETGSFKVKIDYSPNVGTCSYAANGSSVLNNNSWSKTQAGVWTDVGSNDQLCRDGCKFKDIMSRERTSAYLMMRCSNSAGSTSKSLVIYTE